MEHFDFCQAMRLLCTDICRQHPKFRHIDMSRVAVTFAQTRSPVMWGMQAKLTPLRFEGGALTCTRDQQEWTVQRIMYEGVEVLYLLTFYLPRFLDQTFEEKLITVFHELYHIGERFDGDIRRFEGKCYVHTGSQAAYDRQMGHFAQEYLKQRRPQQLLEFLRFDFQGLQRSFGRVVGLRVAIPKLIRVDDVAA